MPGVIGGMIERPKMTRSMYQALKRHILAEREKKKQEKEQDEELERQKKERELRKKKAEEESLTLEQTKEGVARDIANLETKLEALKREKHELFSQLKKVLHQEGETKKKAQLKEQSEMMTIAPQYSQHGIPGGHMGYLHGGMTPQQSKYLRPIQHHQQVVPSMKRARSPSPPPAPGSAMAYSPYSGGSAKYPASSTYTTTPVKQETYPKEGRYGSQSTHVTYATQSAHTYQQAAQPQSGAYARDQSASSSTKYGSTPGSQSAFSSYPSHYAAHQQKTITDPHYPAGYRVPAQTGQHGYMNSSHSGSSLPLQQQLEHANQKSGFSEEKFKLQQQQIRGIAPVPQNPAVLPHHAAAAASTTQKGSIVAGYPVRTQASSATYPVVSSQSAYSQSANQQPRHSYPGQPQNRYY